VAGKEDSEGGHLRKMVGKALVYVADK
jgi:hypothetical protein